jgi:hypothetical protein
VRMLRTFNAWAEAFRDESSRLADAAPGTEGASRGGGS